MRSRASRIRMSLVAALVGWFASTVATLPYESWELARNAAKGQQLLELAEGDSLWCLFTLILAALLWGVIVLAVAAFVRAEVIVRHRGAIALGGSVVAVGIIGLKLGVWAGYFHRNNPSNPLVNIPFWEYSTFAVIFTCVTTFAYARLLEGPARARQTADAVSI